MGFRGSVVLEIIGGLAVCKANAPHTVLSLQLSTFLWQKPNSQGDSKDRAPSNGNVSIKAKESTMCNSGCHANFMYFEMIA